MRGICCLAEELSASAEGCGQAPRAYRTAVGMKLRQLVAGGWVCVIGVQVWRVGCALLVCRSGDLNVHYWCAGLRTLVLADSVCMIFTEDKILCTSRKLDYGCCRNV